MIIRNYVKKLRVHCWRLKKKMVNVIVTIALFHIVTCWSSDHVLVTEQSQPVNWLCIVIHWSSYITLNYFHVIVDFVYQHLLFLFFFHLATLATNLSLDSVYRICRTIYISSLYWKALFPTTFPHELCGSYFN